MDTTLRTALGRNQTIDLTTIGRRSGEPRRIEIVLHVIDGRLIISGMPLAGRTRAWLHNVSANPNVILHLKQPGSVADVAGTARVIVDPRERRPLLEAVARNFGRTDVDEMVAHSPLIEITVAGFATEPPRS